MSIHIRMNFRKSKEACKADRPFWQEYIEY